MKKKPIVFYVCGIDYSWELGQCMVKTYATQKALRAAHECTHECGVVQITITEKNAKWIKKQKLVFHNPKKKFEVDIAAYHKRKDALITYDGRLNVEEYHYCHKCQLKRGGKVPKHGHDGVTVFEAICSMCNKKSTIVPSTDYDWPKKDIKSVWD